MQLDGAKVENIFKSQSSSNVFMQSIAKEVVQRFKILCGQGMYVADSLVVRPFVRLLSEEPTNHHPAIPATRPTNHTHTHTCTHTHRYNISDAKRGGFARAMKFYEDKLLAALQIAMKHGVNHNEINDEAFSLSMERQYVCPCARSHPVVT